MSIISDFGLNTPSRSSLILVLSLEDRNQRKESDILRIQKIIRYFEYLRQEPIGVDYTPFHMGDVAYELHENLETLQECGLIEKKNSHYVLTDEGEMAAREIKKCTPEEDIKKLRFSKYLLNDLSTNEVMFFMYMLLPETRKHSIYFPNLEKQKKSLVKSLFLKGRINSVTAAKWLGIKEKEFIESK